MCPYDISYLLFLYFQVSHQSSLQSAQSLTYLSSSLLLPTTTAISEMSAQSCQDMVFWSLDVGQKVKRVLNYPRVGGSILPGVKVTRMRISSQRYQREREKERERKRINRVGGERNLSKRIRLMWTVWGGGLRCRSLNPFSNHDSSSSRGQKSKISMEVVQVITWWSKEARSKKG